MMHAGRYDTCRDGYWAYTLRPDIWPWWYLRFVASGAWERWDETGFWQDIIDIYALMIAEASPMLAAFHAVTDDGRENTFRLAAAAGHYCFRSRAFYDAARFYYLPSLWLRSIHIRSCDFDISEATAHTILMPPEAGHDAPFCGDASTAHQGIGIAGAMRLMAAWLLLMRVTRRHLPIHWAASISKRLILAALLTHARRHLPLRSRHRRYFTNYSQRYALVAHTLGWYRLLARRVNETDLIQYSRPPSQHGYNFARITTPSGIAAFLCSVLFWLIASTRITITYFYLFSRDAGHAASWWLFNAAVFWVTLFIADYGWADNIEPLPFSTWFRFTLR